MDVTLDRSLCLGGSTHRSPCADDQRPNGRPTADLWVVIPAFNEGQRLSQVVDDVLRVTRNVVVVDDGSTDDTRNLARHRDVWLLRHAVNLGQGAALQTGIAFAIQKGAHYVATFDADGQHCSEDLSTLLSVLIDEQAEFVLGSRFLGRAEGIPAMRRAVLRFGVLFTRVASRVTLTDVHNGIRVMTRRGAERLRISMNRMEHASQIVDQIAKSGMRFVEAPVTVRYTPESLAKGQRTSAALRIGFQTLIDKLVTW